MTKPGVDKSVFFPIGGKEKHSLKESLGLPHDKVVLLCVGRCVKAKGFELALQSMVSNEQCHLVIVGDGPELDNLKVLASSLHVEQSVTFFGARSDVKSFYQASDYFFMSSTYEPLGQTILEAISCSLPS
ncbi:glycosyltransferase [Vibrio sp. JCM 19052]|nr:glycosyltransferase [Vibrio sp. JCM 19052]